MSEVAYGIPDGIFLPNPNGDGIDFCIDDSADPCELLPLSVRAPGGRRIDLHWTVAEVCDGFEPTIGQACAHYPRLAGTTNELGYLIKHVYAYNGDTSAGPPPDWFRRTGARFVNLAEEHCDPEAADCALTQSWPTVGYDEPSSGVIDVTDTGGRTWRFTGGITGIRRPGSTSDDISVSYANGRVASVTRDGVATSYAFGDSGSTRTATVTDALSRQSTVVSDLTIGRPTSVADPLGRTTSFAYDSHGRLTRMTAPEGNYVQHSYDTRGNVAETRAVAKAGSGLADIVASASFPSSCTNAVTCNRPTSTTDARGNVTDYTWDSTHGGVLTVTAPAAPNGVRPQTRLTYSQVTGAAGVPVHLPTATSACQTQASCAGSADEVRTTIGYDSNLQPATVTSGAGDGSLSATSTSAYDRFGNLASIDGPLAGSEDTVRFRYDAARQLVGTISPDPDGAGPLPHRAERTTYRPDGQASRIETGNVVGITDTDWAAMTVAEQVDVGFDGNDRPSSQTLSASGATHAVTHTSYDALGRPECAALRMDASDWGSGAANACAQDPSPGVHGPDRIARTVFDAAGQATQARTAVGTSLEAAEVSTTYTSNGQVETLTDAENNRTTYVHDGHDRLRQTRFPVPTQGALQSSTTDYEELSYDAAGNVTAHRNRAGETTLFAFDALNRWTLLDRPNAEDDVTYGYDLIGRMTSASLPGHPLTFGYDALGRRLTETSPRGTYTSAYDEVGRRTRLTHPDGFFVQHYYLTTGELERIHEWNPATNQPGHMLITFGYDDLGRRTSLTRGNGTVTNYSYDAASRLSQMVQDAGGAAHDLTLGFSYNPASQIISNTRSNDLFATAPVAGAQTAAANGLNQLTSIGGVNTAHDSRGNMTNDGTTSYAYTSDNLMVNGAGVQLYYDPLNRLVQVTGSPVTRFTYDGVDLIAEWDGANNFLRRYVHGPGIDEPLVRYEGPGIANRTYFHADERGSVVAHSDSNAAVVQVNRYDEYGVPASGNAGAFQYTGQRWIGEIGLYYYRARMYNPLRGGRFMQTDPIGYGDGLNWYNYAGGDPVNRTDPTGTEWVSCNTAETRIRACWRDNGNSAPNAGLGAMGQAAQDGGIGLGGAASRAFFGGVGGPFEALGPGAAASGGGVSRLSTSSDIVCPVTQFTVTGIGPRQANTSQRTAITQEPGNRINPRAGLVAINPENFGVPNVAGARRQVFSDIRMYPDWSRATAPVPVPPRPPGLPAAGPYRPIDVIPERQRHPGNQVDLYRYADHDQAFRSTRIVPMMVVIPRNNVGVRCPR